MMVPIMTFLIAKNVLEKAKPIAIKLQERNIDIVEANKMIDYKVSEIKDLKKEDGEFHLWFQNCVRIADESRVLQLVGRQAHSPNAIPGHSTPRPVEYYRIRVAIPL